MRNEGFVSWNASPHNESKSRGNVYSIEAQITRRPSVSQQQLLMRQIGRRPQPRPSPSPQHHSSTPSLSEHPPSAPIQLPSQPPPQLPQAPAEFSVKLKPNGWKEVIEEREEISEREKSE